MESSPGSGRRGGRANSETSGLDLDWVSCKLRDGVLDIAIPVAEQMKPRHMQIQTEDRKAPGA